MSLKTELDKRNKIIEEIKVKESMISGTSDKPLMNCVIR